MQQPVKKYLVYVATYIRAYVHTYVPLQGIVLHSTVSTVSPTQLLPPQDGAGSLQVLVFVLFPPSHNFEQFPTDQFDQPPLTIQYKNIALTELLYACIYCTYIRTWTAMSITMNGINIFPLTVTTTTTGAWLSTVTPLG